MNIIKKIFTRAISNSSKNEVDNTYRDTTDKVDHVFDFMKEGSEYENGKSENYKLRRICKHLWRRVEFDAGGIKKAELDTLNEEQKQKYSELEAEIEILKNDREVQGYLGKQSEFQIWMLWFYEDKSVYLLFVEKLNEYIDLYNEHVIDYNGWNSD